MKPSQDPPRDPLSELGRILASRVNCADHPAVNHRVTTPLEAEQWEKSFESCTSDARKSHLRWLALNDLYYLVAHILEIKTIKTQWHLERCREIEQNCDGIADLWSRSSGKSLIKTYGRVIQEILNNPEICIGIGSHTSPIAKSFLRPIKTTFESHELLKWLFPDVLYENPKQESPSWSLDHGITVKRKTVTRAEPTIMAWGLIDGQPTRLHFDLLAYDDLQQGRESEYMIEKIDNEWQTSLGLSSEKPPRFWMNGVFFRGGSIYESLIERGAVISRIRPAIQPDMTSSIWTDDQVRETLKGLLPGVIACEWLMDPFKKIEGEGFREEWIKYHDTVDLPSSNLYMIVDPGYGKRGKGSKTAILVIALRADRKYYLVDGVAASMNLATRADWTLNLWRQYSPHVKKIAYEHYGLQADVEYLKERVKREGLQDAVHIGRVTSSEMDKDRRIEKLIPIFKEGRFSIPKAIPKRTINDQDTDFLKYFVENEYRKWPATKQKDALDAMSWILHEGDEFKAVFPEGYNDPSVERKEIDWDEGKSGSWMSR